MFELAPPTLLPAYTYALFSQEIILSTKLPKLKRKEGKEIIVSAMARAIGPISNLIEGVQAYDENLTRLRMGNTHHS